MHNIPIKNKEELDNYNIFSLMGLESLSTDRKKTILSDINEIIWKEFLYTRLYQLLSAEDLETAKKLALSDSSGKRVLEFINAHVPYLYFQVADYSREAKIYFLAEQFGNQVKLLSETLEKIKDSNKSAPLIKMLEKYETAIGLLEEGNWKRLQELMQKPVTTISYK